MNKKYYESSSFFSYLLFSIVGAGILVGITIGICNIAGNEFSDNERSYLLFVGIGVSMTFFVIRAFYKRNQRNYVQLSKGLIEWVTYEKGKATSVKIPTNEIRLLEFVYFEGAKLPYFIDVYGNDETPMQQLELDEIPFAAIVDYCKENNIVPLISTIRNLDIERVTVAKKGIKIQYHGNRLVMYGKSKKIPFNEIASLVLVSNHLISKTETHYELSTNSGQIYTFTIPLTNQDTFPHDVEAHGIQISKRYEERKLI